MSRKNEDGEMHGADGLGGQLLLLLEGELRSADSSYCSPGIHKASSRKSHPAALAWPMLNEIQTLVNMAAIQERARPASWSKWCL